MTVKEYLGQAYRLDQRINSKLEQVASLNELATKCTSTLTGMPRNPNRGTSTMADAVGKIVDLQAEINRDIDRLVDLKREMVRLIKAVDNTEYQTLLELRYLLQQGLMKEVLMLQLQRMLLLLLDFCSFSSYQR